MEKVMPAFDFLLKEQFLNKPECVVNFPEWLLPSQEIEKYRAMSELAVVEIAGRDSIAAKSVKKKVSQICFPLMSIQERSTDPGRLSCLFAQCSYPHCSDARQGAGYFWKKGAA